MLASKSMPDDTALPNLSIDEREGVLAVFWETPKEEYCAISAGNIPNPIKYLSTPVQDLVIFLVLLYNTSSLCICQNLYIKKY